MSFFDLFSKKEKTKNLLFIISASLLFLFCTLRYGLGFDYFNYQVIFDSVPTEFSLTATFEGIHGERLFLFIFLLFKAIGIDYAYANSIIIAIIAIFFIRFINKYSSYKTFSVLVLYAWFFVYVFALLRQGLAMSLFCGLAYPMLTKKAYVKYYLTILVCIFIHSASFVCLFVPFVIKYFPRLRKYYLLIVLFLFGLLPFSGILLSIIGRLTGATYYLTEGELSIGALLNRIIVFLIIFYLCKTKDKTLSSMKDLYFLGFFIYLLTAQSDLIASRLGAYFKIFEIILLPICFNKFSYKSSPIAFFIIYVYLGYMLMSIIGTMSDQYGYANAWDYPYVTIFNQDDLVIFEHNY